MVLPYPTPIIRLICFGRVVRAGDRLPWNGWVRAEDDPFPSYETGAYWDAVQHLLTCRRCRRASGLTLREVRRTAKGLEAEWREVTDP